MRLSAKPGGRVVLTAPERCLTSHVLLGSFVAAFSVTFIIYVVFFTYSFIANMDLLTQVYFSIDPAERNHFYQQKISKGLTILK
ncbi:hypothetical protein O3P69_006473 [Scylla paramamosain]|uniref:Uncharacterized protein n=1 Tax=Scylla paramamosain TaxID=85552 RepID=A0AAW0U7F3_SCYPA